MFKALVVDLKQKSREVITEALVNDFGAEVLHFESADKAIEVLKSGKHFDLFVLRSVIDDEQTASKIINFLYDQSLKKAIIILGKIDNVLKGAVCFEDKFRIEQFNREVLKLLNLEKESMAKMKWPMYFAIPIHAYEWIDCSRFNFYIKKN